MSTFRRGRVMRRSRSTFFRFATVHEIRNIHILSSIEGVMPVTVNVLVLLLAELVCAFWSESDLGDSLDSARFCCAFSTSQDAKLGAYRSDRRAPNASRSRFSMLSPARIVLDISSLVCGLENTPISSTSATNCVWNTYKLKRSSQSDHDILHPCSCVISCQTHFNFSTCQEHVIGFGIISYHRDI